MFTGIIEATGSIETISVKQNDAVVTINSGKLDLSDVKLGDSIATNGVCLTVTRLGSQSFSADVSGETLKRTTFATAKARTSVNLEKAMLPTTRFGGHMVSGHVDGVGTVVEKTQVGKACEFWLSAPKNIGKYIAEKGSITVDGISLTVNAVKGQQFMLTIVPHTSGETTIDRFKVGTKVNLEVDLIARYVERLLTSDKEQSSQGEPQGVTMALLASSGYKV
ncbi:MAG: riboflavin synthase [Psychrosphaera sp.]|nr:riboflavin synthase [Psychrosphaera sp.]